MRARETARSALARACHAGHCVLLRRAVANRPWTASDTARHGRPERPGRECPELADGKRRISEAAPSLKKDLPQGTLMP